MGIQNTFSIKDLENLSGVKAHTIRIWEKRYDLLTPERTETNIRLYNLENLQKLLNISYLNENGIKVSKIAKLSQEELAGKVKEISSKTASQTYLSEINMFKLAMINFDSFLFNKTYANLLARTSFRDVFFKVFIPLLEEIGLLWTTKTLKPTHERFISTLIKQKILLNIEHIQLAGDGDLSHAYVLFLPEQELHDIGLLYVQFELLLKGHHSIVLGESIPMTDLLAIQQNYEKISYVTYFTVCPEVSELANYLNKFDQLLLQPRNEHLHVLGNHTKNLDTSDLSPNIHLYHNILQFFDNV